MHLSWPIVTRAVVILAAATFAACNKPVAEEEPEPEPIVRTTPPPATPVATPVAVVATPELNYFAPPGVYYLVSASSVETPEGIVGLTPGTKLQKVAPGKFTANGHQIDLRESQVTNDLRVAQSVAGADQAAQAALRRALSAAVKTAPVNPATTPSATPNTVVAVAQPKKSNAPATGLGKSLGGSGALGKTRSQDGWIWQMDANGNWQPLRRDK